MIEKRGNVAQRPVIGVFFYDLNNQLISARWRHRRVVTQHGNANLPSANVIIG